MHLYLYIMIFRLFSIELQKRRSCLLHFFRLTFLFRFYRCLLLPHAMIPTLESEQLGMRATLDDSTLVKHHNLV